MNRGQIEARIRIWGAEPCLSHVNDILEKPEIEISRLKEFNFSGYR